MIKKVLGFAISLSMMMSTMSAFAEEIKISDDENNVKNVNNYIINDQFASGTDGWVAGEVASGFSKATISNVPSYTDASGITADGVMKIVFDGTGNQYVFGQMQTAYREFETPYK